jgi:hypothetical protein
MPRAGTADSDSSAGAGANTGVSIVQKVCAVRHPGDGVGWCAGGNEEMHRVHEPVCTEHVKWRQGVPRRSRVDHRSPAEQHATRDDVVLFRRDNPQRKIEWTESTALAHSM